MKVLLIAPTALDFHGNPIKQRKLHLPALTLPMLAAVTPSHIDLRICSETVEDIPFGEKWDLVGLTGMGSGIVRAWQIADAFREQGVPVVIGGIAASLGRPEWTLAHADSLVIGEAEELWPVLIDDFASGRMQKVYRSAQPPAIDNLPVPRYHLMNRKTIGFWRPVQATRGCPFTCNFCSITSFFGGGYRKRPIDQILRDVKAAKRDGSRYIAFIDDNIGVDLDYCSSLWEALIPEKIIWMSQCSLHITQHRELMKLAHRSGCRMLSIGIESTSDENLGMIDKKWNQPGRYSSAFKALREHGIEVSTEMMIGLDHDDQSVFDSVFRFIQENRIAVPRVHIMTPVPGTPLYEKLFHEGRIVHQDFGRYSGGKVVFKPARLTASELQAGYWRLYERLFSIRSVLSRIVPNRAGLGPTMQGVVWAVNFHYRQHIQHRICPGIV